MNETALECALRNCSLHSLLMISVKALSRSGFGDVQILDRRHRRQKSRFGGHELLCQGYMGTLPMRVIVKVVRDDVRTRMLDELAGAVQRRQADAGVLITPFRLGDSARRVLGDYAASRVEVVDGAAFAEILTRHGIGVRKSGEPDYAFLASLEDVSNRLIKFISRERP